MGIGFLKLNTSIVLGLQIGPKELQQTAKKIKRKAQIGLLVNNITNSVKLAYNWPIWLDFKIRKISIN